MSAAAAEGAGAGAPLRWAELAEATRGAVEGRLRGLYGGGRDEEVFDSLAPDKQQALLILARRLGELKLWDAVRRVENVYGEGGVGMRFRAWPFLKSELLRRAAFSTWFAAHGDTALGFMERGRRLGSLHLLHVGGDCWEGHFDLYNPWASPANAWRHLLHEKIRREVPDWRAVGAALGYL